MIAAEPPDESTAPTTRCRILATAARFFQEIGYQKTTVADIAKTLGMSPANVYRFFDSKKAINEAVVERLTGEVEAMIAAVADRPGPASERLRAIIHTLHRDSAERITANPRMHEMVEAAMTESWGVCHHHVDRITAVLERVITEGVAAGEFRVGDPAQAARYVQTAILRYCHPVLIQRCPGDVAPPLDGMIDFLLAGLRAA
ncbi:transcriptional regulator, TetR family [Methylobacterium sp. 4-46]|uniref:TetR/AcrR family transcriptional regulator n=1 Tax=unclassified Methylobacterium TaxID=2615210 RepID=UPI000152CC10|nr:MULTISPECIES: TetR/AcrR family transcriptional regulator [Methylobacterium]ACA19789.1 transcriptional regulator, TetR family [Methylobacterium sp. 4-46]WFT78976.1 TetR/AcrR family transcriptional regulator [Methylobacterium nodulans]